MKRQRNKGASLAVSNSYNKKFEQKAFEEGRNRRYEFRAISDESNYLLKAWKNEIKKRELDHELDD